MEKINLKIKIIKMYQIFQKFKYDLQSKWEKEVFQTGGKVFLNFKEAQEKKKGLQRMSSSMQYKVIKLQD